MQQATMISSPVYIFTLITLLMFFSFLFYQVADFDELIATSKKINLENHQVLEKINNMHDLFFIEYRREQEND